VPTERVLIALVAACDGRVKAKTSAALKINFEMLCNVELQLVVEKGHKSSSS
jgi:hypothetical protein